MKDRPHDIFGKPLYSIDELREMQEKDKEPMRLAVEEALLPSLEGDAAVHGRELAEKCGAYNLYGAIEAVNILLMRVEDSSQSQKMLMRRNGDVVVNNDTIPVAELALEVARFTEQTIDKELQSAAEAFAMVRWIWEAMKYQPDLLEDFVATATDDPDCLLLTAQTKQGCVSDPRQRWVCSASK